MAESKDVSMDGWPSEERLLFHWDVQDTLQRQDLLLDIRHDQTYPYSNLYVFLTYRSPTGDRAWTRWSARWPMKGESGAEVVLATWSITAFCFNRAFNSPSRSLWTGGPARDAARPHSVSGQRWPALEAHQGDLRP